MARVRATYCLFCDVNHRLYFQPNYLGPLGISIATASTAPILLIALGQSMVLNVGSIDLSNAASSLFGAILLALSVPNFGGVSIIVVLTLLTFLGAINGTILAYIQIPSFALTLGTLCILKSATLVISGSETIYVTNNRELITLLYSTKLGGGIADLLAGYCHCFGFLGCFASYHDRPRYDWHW